jgi:alkanesulfonate monooxygenase SsuD/methylene tetrahydromethanopterin reductase-like flavin-dependent oxidoreductase (luciferase family)
VSHDLNLPQMADDPATIAETAEDFGYGGVWLGELWGTSSVVKLSEIATRTEEIGIGTAILNVYSRSPAVLAMTAATLDDVSGGRFTLGVGTSTPKAVEDLHSMSFDRPVRRSHETIDLVKQFLAGEGRIDYDGEVYETADFPALGVDVDVYHAALGRANRRVVARLADGWIPHNVPFPDLPEAFDYIVDHTPEDREVDDISVAPYVPAAVSEDAEEARDAVRGHIAYYVGSGDGYRRAVARRFPEGADRVAELWRDGERGDATDAVTDEMLEALGVAGTAAEARDQFEEIASMDVVDRPMVTVPNNATDLAEETVAALAPSEF